MTIRQAARSDLPAILALVADAQAFLKSRGVDQWQDGYPPASAFEADIAREACHVLCDDACVVGVCSLLFGEEPSYRVLDSGAWLSDGSYATIHRVALAAALRGTGAADRLFQFCERRAREAGVVSLRVDTHADNRAMRGALARNGFVYVGDITLYRGTPDEMPRIALEKLL